MTVVVVFGFADLESAAVGFGYAAAGFGCAAAAAVDVAAPGCAAGFDDIVPVAATDVVVAAVFAAAPCEAVPVAFQDALMQDYGF